MTSVPNSPYGGAPERGIEELLDDPEEFWKYMNIPRDTNTNYRDEDQYRKDPQRSGVPGESI